MRRTYRVLAMGLAVSVGVLPLGDIPALAAEAATNSELRAAEFLGNETLRYAGGTSTDSGLIKHEIIQYGIGSNLKVRLADGKKLKGSVVNLGEEGFELRAKPKEPPRHIAYSQVTEIKPTKLVYRAKGQPDAVEARRTVLGLGVGRHIQVRTTAGGTYHGNIQTISTDTFTLLPDRQTSSVEIPFSQVQYVEQNLSMVTKIVIAVVVIATVVVVVVIVKSVNAINESF